MRVCSPEIFPVYFRMAVPEGELTNAEVEAILAIASNTGALAAKFRDLSQQLRPDGSTRARVMLERLEDYTERDVLLEAIPQFIQALFLVGDDLNVSEDRSRGMFDFDNDMRIARLNYRLLSRLENAKRIEVLRGAISNSSAISTIAHEVALLEPSRRKDDEPGESLVRPDDFPEIKELALGKIRDAAANKILADTPALAMVLYRWRDWAGIEEPKDWLKELWASDQDLINVLKHFKVAVYTQSMGDVIGERKYRFDTKLLTEIFSQKQWIDRLRQIQANASELSEDQQDLVRGALEAFEGKVDSDLF